MSTSQSWTIYQISSVSYFDQNIVLDTRRISGLTDTEAFNIASYICTTFGGTFGSDVYVDKTDWTAVGYTTNYTAKTFS